MKNIFEEISTHPSKKDKEKKHKLQKQTEKYVEKIRELQHVLYAENKHSLLIVLQGMDASGKDGATKAVFASVNPQGVSVKSFKKPTELELSHDFLWRIHQECPETGMIKVFNRSHYEDLLVPMVYGGVSAQALQRRVEYINSFERMLHDNKTTILKFYLHVSEKEQQKRFEERLTNPEKNWKFNKADMETAKLWPSFRRAYQRVFDECGETPWHIIPSDENWYKKYLITKKVAETLESLDLQYPKLKAT